MDTFEVAVLGCEVETGHTIVATQGHVCAHVKQVPDHVHFTLAASHHQGGTLFLVERIQFGSNLKYSSCLLAGVG